MSRLTQEMLDHVERAVQGTCQSLMENFDRTADFYNFGFEFDDLTAEEEMQVIGYVEDRHFECHECGWWCEAGDYNMEACEATGENICSQCGEEYNNE